MTPPTIRVLIADDQQLVRAGFRMILATQPDIDVVGTGAEAITLSRQTGPDVNLMDIRMPHTDGIEATRRILAQPSSAPPRVLILTTFDMDEYVYDAYAPEQAGSCSKTCHPNSSSRASG